jgi:hypothetical protein
MSHESRILYTTRMVLTVGIITLFIYVKGHISCLNLFYSYWWKMYRTVETFRSKKECFLLFQKIINSPILR